MQTLPPLHGQLPPPPYGRNEDDLERLDDEEEERLRVAADRFFDGDDSCGNEIFGALNP